MKKVDEIDDDMPAEIDFRGGERGRFAERFAEGTNLIALAPDVMEVFPDAESVNEALRLMAQIAKRTAQPQKVH
jgi:hypothetical protein